LRKHANLREIVAVFAKAEEGDGTPIQHVPSTIAIITPFLGGN
jgi:hypothetical protein